MELQITRKSVGSTMSTRKCLHNNQKILSIFCLIFAAVGIGLMIIEIEIVSYNASNQISQLCFVCFFLKVLVSFFTGLLLICLVFYHRASILLFMVENNLNSWRFVITVRLSLSIFIELAICAIHAPPIPNYNYVWTTYRLILGRPEKEDVPLDVIITIIMFLRGYLIFRVMVLHSHVYDNSSSRCVELMQGKSINSQFALKYLLTIYSKAFLIVSVICVILWTSWAVRVCEIYEKDSNLRFFNNIWFIAITFMTIGYGDIVPRSVCGRFIAVLSGVFGVMYTAYVVAIIAESLQLSYSESYLHQFVVDSDLDKSIKEQAVIIIQNFWRLKRAIKTENYDTSDVFRWKLKLIKSKKNLKIFKNEKIQLETKSLRISTLYYSQSQMQQEILQIKNQITNINELISYISNRLQK